MHIPSHADLIAHIDRFQQRHPRLKDWRLGVEVTGEPGLIGRLRAGASPSIRIAAKLVDFMARKDAELSDAQSDDPTATPDQVSGREARA